jgi:nickel superoxide dismutase
MWMVMVLDLRKEATMTQIGLFLVLLAVVAATSTSAFAHCEVPCGIYDDEMRCEMIAEHITTIEKAMKEIVSLSKADEVNFNQLVRWIENKEHHATELQHIVTQYFMTQRIKPADEGDAKAYKDYVDKLTLLHGMVVHAMKAKQTTDLEHVETLRVLLDKFKTAYFAKQ